MQIRKTFHSVSGIWMTVRSGSELHDILYDLDTVRRLGPTSGLLLKEKKCEIITTDDNVVRSIQARMRNILHIPSNVIVLLGESAINTLLHS